MATNLLLEGDDLEALLIKAHSEGGSNARIVRADKYRHGGLWGFFAKERFEVAVEIPNTSVFAQPSAAQPEVSAPQAGRRMDALLGIADRVSAAEQAAVRTAQARYTSHESDSTFVVPLDEPIPAHQQIDLQTRELEARELSSADVGVGGQWDGGHSASQSAVWSGSDSHSDSPPGPSDDQLAEQTPSSGRPEFTALLDTLVELEFEPVIDEELPEAGLPQSDPRTAADRRTLRALGVPAAWTRLLRPGDRFTEVLRMLNRMPADDIDPATTIVAVVGPVSSARLEAHQTALDLAIGAEPRPVVVVPACVGSDRAASVARAVCGGPAVIAVETDSDDPAASLDTLATIQAGAVIAVVDATAPLEDTQRWLDALGQVDALVINGATEVSDPASVLRLGLPVIRLDGVPVDHVTWTALLCAQLVAHESAAATSPTTIPTAAATADR